MGANTVEVALHRALRRLRAQLEVAAEPADARPGLTAAADAV